VIPPANPAITPLAKTQAAQQSPTAISERFHATVVGYAFRGL
jgi:hypothetical protein